MGPDGSCRSAFPFCVVHSLVPLIAPARLGSSTWLLHLRSFAVAGQLLTILVAWGATPIELPYAALLALVFLTLVTNLAYGVWLHRTRRTRWGSSEAKIDPLVGEMPESATPARRMALGLMLLDLITLTAMLYLSGGADNPFSFFYFVNLAVGGVMIRPVGAWALTGLAIAGYTLLLYRSMPVEGLSVGRSGEALDLRSLGLMLAFATCSSVVTYFVTRTAGELRQREQLLLGAQAERAASHRLEGLTTLAAGAAHELASPLSTIDVIVRELSRHLESVDKPKSVDTDLKLIDAQLEMCRQILQRMRSAAGDSMAHQWDRTTVGDLIDATLEGIRDPHRVDVFDGDDAVENQPLWLPQEAVAQAIRNLIHNGLDASGPEGRVRVDAAITGDRLRLVVVDTGQGMTDEVLDRAGDPFFTTKEPGRGIGLGLFLTRNVVSRLGGEVTFRSRPGHGTHAIVDLPLSSLGQSPGQESPAALE